MKYALSLLALVGAVTAAPQGVTGYIAPEASAPDGCSLSYNGGFQITAVTVAAKRDLAARGDCGSDGSLTLQLANGVLTDAKGRIGSIVANYQFQFDGPPAQTGAIYTGGFSACTNGSLALGGSAVFYQCLSGSFYNLYDRAWAEQCSPVEIEMLPCSASTTTSPATTDATGSQPAGTVISQINDGQPQAQSAVPISEFSDGQPQVPTLAPPKITQIGDGQIQAPTALATITPVASAAVAPISQIGDGQIQAPTGTPEAATAAPEAGSAAPVASAAPAVSPVSVAPAEAASGAPISQITDGQIQVATTAPVVSVAPATTVAPISPQVQETNTTTAPPAPSNFVGAASLYSVGAEVVVLAAGLAAIGLL